MQFTSENKTYLIRSFSLECPPESTAVLRAKEIFSLGGNPSSISASFH